MTSWAKPGAKCICISRHPDWDLPENRRIATPIIGETYTVRAFDGEAVLLEEIRNNIYWLNGTRIGEPDFGVFRFQPLVSRQDDLALFAHHLDRVVEPA